MTEFDRTLKCGDIMKELNISAYMATLFLERFGITTHTPKCKQRIIGQRRLRTLQLDGEVAEWLSQHRLRA